MGDTAKKELRIWQVSHPELGGIIVQAENWELATVEAAKSWGVPWGKTVAEMSCDGSVRTVNHICARCGRIFNASGGICDACKLVMETEREQDRLRLLKTWYLGRRDAKFGT